MAPKKEKMPSMKELQDLLAALDAEGGLSMGGGEESANLDDLYEDSYLHAILHNKINQDKVKIPTTTPSQEEELQDSDKTPQGKNTSSPSTYTFDTLNLPQGYSWGDDHETLGQGLLVRPGYAAVLSALLSTSHPDKQTSQSIFLATGSPGIGRSCLAYYLVYKIFEAGHDIVISDPMFTNAFVNGQYYSCYSPHLEKHTVIYQAISSTSPSSSPSKKPTWWICDDGFLPIKGAKCQVLVTVATAQIDKSIETIHKKNKLAMPVQFQIPKWSMDEIKAGLLVSMSEVAPRITDISLTKDQELVIEDLFVKFKGSPRKIFVWVKSNWATEAESKAKSKTKNKTKSKSSKGRSEQ
ncbi:hypothetical protein BGZ49_002848 [Haplosporangium sp. Z 27]|nr:hypothetical protein BGZ49_002848 [Haplosporangium sp. Z 27]